MEFFQSTIDRLASPLVLYSAALLGIALASRTRLLLGRWGGAALLVLTAAMIATGLRDAGFRELLLDPGRLPALVWLVTSLTFLWLALYRAQNADPTLDPGSVESAAQDSRRVEAAVVVVAGLSAMACAYFLEPPLGASLLDRAAEAGAAPAVKAPWFLAVFQEMRFYFDPWVATTGLPALYFFALLALPYLDAGGAEDDAVRERRRRLTFAGACVLLVLLPVATAVFLRGPHWNAYGPFEVHDAERPHPAPALPLSEVFWCRGLGLSAAPSAWWLRELPGAALLAAFFLLLPWWLSRWSATRKALGRYRQAVGPWRYRLAWALALSLAIVPLKMYGRWLFGVGYWLRFPELSFGF